MFTVRRTKFFEKWLLKLRDHQARLSIGVRLDRLRNGHFGDVKPVGGGVSEMRIHCGAGYRIYFIRHGDVLVVLLCGGDKRTQAKDVKTAIAMTNNMEDMNQWLEK